MTPLPEISTEAELLAVIAERGSISTHDIEESEHVKIYGQLINSLVDKNALDCIWSDPIPADDGFYFLATQTWSIKKTP